jgi:multidrug resistance efflux pump
VASTTWFDDEKNSPQAELQRSTQSDEPEIRSMKSRDKVLRWFGLAALLAAVTGAFWFATLPPPLNVQGEVSSDRVDISSRVAARVEKINADVGYNVKKGDILAMLNSPQLVSSRAAAAAALAVARANLAKVETIRPENVVAQKAEAEAARADVTLALQTFNRQAELKRTGDTPQASLDQAQHNLDAATQRKDAAEANLQLTIEGARRSAIWQRVRSNRPKQLSDNGLLTSKNSQFGRRPRARLLRVWPLSAKTSASAHLCFP